jgi:predicted nucleic acid-binding protein
MGYMLDTNIFGWLIASKLKVEDLPKGDYFVTHVQVEELSAAGDKETRAQLAIIQASLRPHMVNTETAVAGMTRASVANSSDGVLFEKLRTALDALNKFKANNTMDALIGEVGIVHGYVLLTADKHLARVVRQHGGKVQLFDP